MPVLSARCFLLLLWLLLARPLVATLLLLRLLVRRLMEKNDRRLVRPGESRGELYS